MITSIIKYGMNLRIFSQTSTVHLSLILLKKRKSVEYGRDDATRFWLRDKKRRKGSWKVGPKLFGPQQER